MKPTLSNEHQSDYHNTRAAGHYGAFGQTRENAVIQGFSAPPVQKQAKKNLPGLGQVC